MVLKYGKIWLNNFRGSRRIRENSENYIPRNLSPIYTVLQFF